MNNSKDLNQSLDVFTSLKRELRSRGTITVVVESFVFVVFAVTGLLGNVCVCLAVFRNTSLRLKATNIAVAALAISDVLTCSVIASFILAVLKSGQWMFGDAVCKFQAVAMYALVGVSLYLMALIAVNRYYCVVKPEKYRVIFSYKSTFMFVILIWLVVFGTMLAFYAFKLFSFYFHPFKVTCVLYTAPVKDSVILSHLANYASTAGFIMIPISIFIFFYARIFHHVRRHRINVASTLQNPELHGSSLSSRAAELKMTRTMFVIVFVYVLCWIPVFVTEIVMNTAYAWHEIDRTLALTCTALGLLSSVINPWIISIMNRTFRKEVYKILRCKFD
ncbi:neuropeptide Y receptor type 4-2-like [Oculina patagonica]